MAKEIPRDQPRPTVNISDPETRQSCRTIRVLDITEDCPQHKTRGKIFMMFAQSADGIVVQFYYNKGERSTYFHLAEIEEECLMPEGRFVKTSQLLGLTARQLQRLIAHVQI